MRQKRGRVVIDMADEELGQGTIPKRIHLANPHLIELGAVILARGQRGVGGLGGE